MIYVSSITKGQGAYKAQRDSLEDGLRHIRSFPRNRIVLYEGKKEAVHAIVRKLERQLASLDVDQNNNRRGAIMDQRRRAEEVMCYSCVDVGCAICL